jgi:hypothetical protein
VGGQYVLPRHLVAGLVWSALARRRRSFVSDALRVMATVEAPELVGAENIPRRGPCIVTCNHYTRPGFGSWWLTLSVTAAVATCRAAGAEREVHWVIADAWTYPDRWRSHLITPATRWAFRRVARTYDFVSMPPMPPRPHEVAARASAVLQTVRLARALAGRGGMVGLAPEGGDMPDGLGRPPAGAGEFIGLLAAVRLPVLPVGVSEADDRLVISFGPTFIPALPSARAERDASVSGQVMAAIARRLPIAFPGAQAYR